jgi:hypothetical protein
MVYMCFPCQVNPDQPGDNPQKTLDQLLCQTCIRFGGKEKMIVFTLDPKFVQQNSQFARNRHHRSFFGIPDTTLGHTQNPSSQMAFFPKGAQDVLDTPYQQMPQVLISYPSLWICIPRLISSGHQS